MNKFNILFAALAAGILFFSCDKPEPEPEPGPGGTVDPVVPEVVVTFPDLVENFEVKPGETLSLTFTPAKDWSVSVPSENIQWFWIADGSFKVDKLSGKASEEAVTVKIGVSETEEFDTNRSCDVTLTIGDESKVIAQYMRPAKERTIAVYTAEGTEEVETVNIEWSAENADFRTLLRVESNYEWTVSYPDWLKVNVPEKTIGVVELMLTGESLEDVSGKLEFKAGEATVKEITVNLPSCKGMDIYSAQVEEGEFKYADEGGYLWTEAAVEEVELAWLGSDFRMPVKISSKCEWTAELPEWLTFEKPEKTAGEVTLTLLGVPSKYPLEDASGKIVFKVDETVINEVKVTIPGCKDIMSKSLGMALESLDFNAAGEVMTSTGYADVDVTASIFGTSKVEVFVFEKVAGKYLLDKAPEWVKVTVSAFNTASDASVLQEREVKISVTENNSGDREAVMIVAPHSLYGNVKAAFTDDRTAVKEEYQECAVSISQLSNKFVITMNSTPEAMEEAGASFEEASAEKKAELIGAFGDTDQVYVLTYDNIYALDEARMSMSRTYASVKIYDNAKKDQSAEKDFWLAFKVDETLNSGVVTMYFNDDPALMPKLPTEPGVGYVVFYDESGETLAILECISPFEEAYFSVNTQSLLFAPDASEQEVEITTNVEWTVVSEAEWCTVTPNSGAESSIITVTVDKNESDVERSTTVTISTSENTVVIPVVQKCGEVLEISSSNVEFDFKASTKSLKVTSNVDWTIESSADWCEVTPASGTGAANVTVAVKRNGLSEIRTATITLKSSTLTKTITVTQTFDDGSTTNGDDVVHFVDFSAARAAGATLERLTSGKLYKEYRDGDVPVYHLTYTSESLPLNITLPENIIKHNVNPYGNCRNIRVNDTVYEEYFGPNDILGEVVMDSNNSVAIYMTMPSGKDYMRGNINFLSSGDTLAVILICTFDLSAE